MSPRVNCRCGEVTTSSRSMLGQKLPLGAGRVQVLSSTFPPILTFGTSQKHQGGYNIGKGMSLEPWVYQTYTFGGVGWE